ncbi:histidine phosphatase family protein [Microlunatus elymi]|uniref:Histidine phosphatase family protein n=1 Tax=Microlunatus elymi TaxID=2596828 RepID=A0A516PVH0_9ACTN|nr:histidine phosphatase family protein [Microlunatus elymi]QDP95185.1 histidine phosphatase family protein [Microlunatus elymi]
MAGKHTLLLLRHAQAAEYAGGVRDHERPLTDRGIEQATEVGNAIRAEGVSIDQVLCSSATRTRQTWSALGLDSKIEFSDEIYSAGSDTLLESARLLDEEVVTAMIIGHGPALPRLAVELAGPGSDQRSLDVINSRYPTATLAAYEVDVPWADLQVGRLLWLRLGRH